MPQYTDNHFSEARQPSSEGLPTDRLRCDRNLSSDIEN